MKFPCWKFEDFTENAALLWIGASFVQVALLHDRWLAATQVPNAGEEAGVAALLRFCHHYEGTAREVYLAVMILLAFLVETTL